MAAWRAAGFDVAAVTTGEDLRAGSRTDSRLRERVEAFRPDIVQVGPLTNPAWDVIGIWDGPLIATSWGFDLLQEIDQDLGVEERARAVLERANLLFVDNDAPRKRALELGVDAGRIVQFPWGLDEQWFALRDAPAMSDPTTLNVVCTRRHEEIYRVGDVLASFIDAALDRGNIRLHLIGSGSLTPELETRVAASGLAHRIDFLGELENSLLPEAYRRADIYVTASEVDGTSVSLLEAMASSAVVVASLNAGNVQWLSDDTGYGFDVGDISALTTILVGLAAMDPDSIAEARRRAAGGRAQVERNANWKVTAQRFPDFARAAIDHWEGA